MHGTIYGQVKPKRNTCALVFDWFLIVLFTLQVVAILRSAINDCISSNLDIPLILEYTRIIVTLIAMIRILFIFVSGTITDEKAQVAKMTSQIGMVLHVFFVVASIVASSVAGIDMLMNWINIFYGIIFFAVTWSISSKPKDGLAQALLPYPPQK